MRSAAFGLIALTSCSAITSFDGLAGTASGDDASIQAADAADTKIASDASDVATNEDAGPSCDLTKPFGAPVLVPGVNTTALEGSGRLSPDELTIYFESDRAGGLGNTDIWFATRASREDAFLPAQNLTSVNTANNDYDPTISEDGLTLIVSQPNSNSTAGLFAWTRTTPTGVFGSPTELTQVETSGGNFFQPYLGQHDEVLCFNNDDAAIACATRGGNGQFGAAAFVSGFTGSTYPVLSADGLTFYFTGGNIYESTRASTSDAFSQETDVTSLDGLPHEGSDWLSPDGCRLYLEINQAGGVGGDDIYVATKPQ